MKKNYKKFHLHSLTSVVYALAMAKISLKFGASNNIKIQLYV